MPAQGAVFSYISFVGSRTHGRGTFCSRKKYPKTRRGVPPVPQFYGGVQSAFIKFGASLPLNYVFTSDLRRVYRRCFGCRPRRHKLRIPHPAASGRLRSLRCASFFLGKRCAGLPRSGPCGAVLVSHRTIGNAGGFQRGQCPLCVVAEEGVTGEKPHRKGFSLRAPFCLLFRRGKSRSGYGGEAPEKFREETCFSPTRPAIRESALYRPDAPAQKHQNRLEAPHAAMRQRTPSALMAGLMVSSLSMAMAEAARPARAVFSRSVPSR